MSQKKCFGHPALPYLKWVLVCLFAVFMLGWSGDRNKDKDSRWDGTKTITTSQEYSYEDSESQREVQFFKRAEKKPVDPRAQAYHDARRQDNTQKMREIESQLRLPLTENAECYGEPTIKISGSAGYPGEPGISNEPRGVSPFLSPDWGTDIHVRSVNTDFRESHPAMATASDGTIYIVWENVGQSGTNDYVQVYYSTDGGDNWTAYGYVENPSYNLREPTLAIGEGGDNVLIIAYIVDDGICPFPEVATSPLISSEFSWTIRAVPYWNWWDGYAKPNLWSDSYDWFGWFGYLTCEGIYDGATSNYNVCFWRSVDYGVTWQDEQAILGDIEADAWRDPDGTYGTIGNNLFVACFNQTDNTLYTRISYDFGATWVDTVAIYTMTDIPFNPVDPDIEAAANYDHVMLCCTKSFNGADNAAQGYSTDGGYTWSTLFSLEGYTPTNEFAIDLTANEGGNNWHVCYTSADWWVYYSTRPQDLSGFWQPFPDKVNDVDWASAAYPKKAITSNWGSDEAGIAWSDYRQGAPDYDIYFDRNVPCPPEIAVLPIPPAFSFTVPEGGTDSDNLTIENIAPPGCDDLIFSIVATSSSAAVSTLVNNEQQRDKTGDRGKPGGYEYNLISNIEYAGAGGAFVNGIRCGTPEPTAEEAQRIREQVDRWLERFGHSSPEATTVIPVAFHVVRHNDGSADVTDTQIQDQVNVLNFSYASSNFQFSLYSIDRTNNTAWSTHSMGSPEEAAMKSALAVNVPSTLNFYTCDLAGGLLGYATFPWMYPEDDFMHGVVCLYASLPGGTAFPYDEGDTGTHEIGHYLGLWHTFQNGCTPPGDEIDDTPYEASAAFGCPHGRDTCPQAGLDPIYNFMDYTDDACMDHFTPDQSQRMDDMVALYRPTLLIGSGWLSVNPTSGTIAAGGFANVTVNVDASGLLPGTYNGTLTIHSNDPGSPLTVPVDLTVTPIIPVLSVTPSNRNVPASIGTTTFDVDNIGGGTMNWTATETETWLTITSGSSGTNSGTIVVDYQANPSPSPRVGDIVVEAPGAQGSPQTVTVTQEGTTSPPVTVTWCGPPPLTGAPGAQITAYVCVDDVSGLNIISYQLTATFDNTVLNCVGATSSGTLTAPFGPPTVNCAVPGEITVGGFGTSPLAGSGQLVGLIFDVVGSPGDFTDICFTNVLFNAGIPPVTIPDPCIRFEIPLDFDIQGDVSYCPNNNPVPNANMTLSGGASGTQITDPGGHYEFNNLAGGLNYTVTPSKVGDADPLFDISCYDAALSAQMALGIIPANHCDSLAADVDENGFIQTFDAALTCRFAVGLPPFGAFDHTGEWRFEPSDRSYNPLTSNHLNEDYSAALLGDVDGNWTPAAPLLTKDHPVVEPYEVLSSLSAGPGEILSVPFMVEAGEAVISADIDFRYDPEIMRFLGVAKTGLSEGFEVISNAEEGRIRVGAFSAEAVNEAGELLSLKFEITAQERERGALKVERYQLNARTLKQAEVEFTVGVPAVPVAFALHQNYPNPFNPETTIRFDIPAVSEKNIRVRLSVYNIAGQLVRTLLDEEFEAGIHEIRWDSRDNTGNLAASGIYLYSISAGDFFATKKMMLLK